MYKKIIDFIRNYYQTKEVIPLHAPTFCGKEYEYVFDTIKSTFVSSVGSYVKKFEAEVAAYTHSAEAIVTMNGTSALHISLLLSGVQSLDYVITQPLTFVATCNAITYCGATPIFIDIDEMTLGLSASALATWLNENAYLNDEGLCCYRPNSRIIRACVPMHTFGHPADIDGLISVCQQWNLCLIEDAAESLGSLYKGKHTGLFGTFGILSFNGNKIITTGGGGMILTQSADLGQKAKHLTTTAKIPHPFEYVHDEVGYNYRLPNINAALGCAQLESLNLFIANKRALAQQYQDFFAQSPFEFFKEPAHCISNYWLNAVVCENKLNRDEFLQQTNNNNILTRPLWTLMHQLPIYQNAPQGKLTQAEWMADRVVNLPSSVKFSGPINA